MNKQEFISDMIQEKMDKEVVLVQVSKRLNKIRSIVDSCLKAYRNDFKSIGTGEINIFEFKSISTGALKVE